MSWQVFLDFVCQALQNALSISIVAIPFFFDKFRDFIVMKFQFSLDKSLEDRKSKNEHKNYMSKVRFDKEFEIYTELSEKTIDSVFASSEIVVFFYNNMTTDEFRETKEIIVEKYNVANKSLQRYAPFIKKQIYDEYFELFKTFRELLNYFTYWERKRKQLEIEGGVDNSTIIIEPPFVSEFTDTSNINAETYTLDSLKSKVICTRNKLSIQSDNVVIKLRSELEKSEVYPNE